MVLLSAHLERIVISCNRDFPLESALHLRHIVASVSLTVPLHIEARADMRIFLKISFGKAIVVFWELVLDSFLLLLIEKQENAISLNAIMFAKLRNHYITSTSEEKKSYWKKKN